MRNYLEAIRNEADAASEAWVKLDQVNTTNDFIAYTTAYLGRAAENCRRNNDVDPEEMLIKAGGLILNALRNLK